MSLVDRPNLIFRGGSPGFNRSHVAAGSNVFSFVGGGSGGAVNFINAPGVALRPTITGSPKTVIDGRIGPMSYNDGSAWNVQYSGLSTAAFPAVTIAAIARLDIVSGGTQVAFSDDSTGNVGAGLILYTASAPNGPQIRIGSQVVAPATAPPALSMGVPYFVAFTGVANAAAGYYVIKNLVTGAKWYGATAAMPGTFSGGGGSLYIANNVGGFANLCGGVAAGMRSNSALTLPQLLAWADNPWEFWYPTTSILLDLAQKPALIPWGAVWGDTLILSDPLQTNPLPTLPLQPLANPRWAGVWGDTVILRDPPREPLPAIALTPTTLPPKVIGMGWHQPPDRDRPRQRISFESPPSAVLTTATLPPKVAGVAWHEPPDRDRPAVRSSLESFPSIALTPATVPPQIAGMAWFTPLDRDYPAKKSFDAPFAFARPVTVQVSGIAWHTSRDQWQTTTRAALTPPSLVPVPAPFSGMAWHQPASTQLMTRRAMTDAPAVVAAPRAAATLFWSVVDDRVVRRPLFDLPAPLVTAPVLQTLSWVSTAVDRLSRGYSLGDAPQPMSLLPMAPPPVVPTPIWGWAAGIDDRLVRKALSDLQPSLVPTATTLLVPTLRLSSDDLVVRKILTETRPSPLTTAALLVPTWGWISISDDRLARKAPPDTVAPSTLAPFTTLSSGWMTLASDRVMPSLSREAPPAAQVVLTKVSSISGVQWATTVDSPVTIRPRVETRAMFIGVPTPQPAIIAGMAWFDPLDQRVRSSWIFENGAMSELWNGQTVAFLPSPRRATAPSRTQSTLATPNT